MVRRLPVKETIAGSIPAAAALGKGKPTGDGSRLENGRAMSLEGSTPSPSALCALGRAAQAPVFQTGIGGFDSHRALCSLCPNLVEWRGVAAGSEKRGPGPVGNRQTTLA